MGKIFCLFGKSSSGKDSVYKMLLADNTLGLKEVTPYTTRPIRSGECEGREYHFVTDKEALKLEQEGRIIELRAYNTVHGVWKYFTADDGQINLSEGNYIIIGTLEAYEKMRDYFGSDVVVPIYIWADDGIRLERALKREQSQTQPKYAEMCRRFLADEEDFSGEKLEAAGIGKRFENRTLQELAEEIKSYMGQCLA